MSMFGGDSWARESQERKRRLDDLMLPASASSSAPGSFKRLSSGKFACLVCHHRPVLDSLLMLSMHNKGARHIASKSRLRDKELSRQQEINTRLALSSEAPFSNSGKPRLHVRPSDTKEKPLIEQTQRAISEARSCRFSDSSAKNESHGHKSTGNALSCDLHVPSSGVLTERWTGNMGLVEYYNSEGELFAGDQTSSMVLSDWKVHLQKQQEQELRFTASGWKRDCHGKWYRDENVEFDSDEDGLTSASAKKTFWIQYSNCSETSNCFFQCSWKARPLTKMAAHLQYQYV